jgi:hypothetical protein
MDNVIKSILRRLASLEKRPTGSVTVTGGGGGTLGGGLYNLLSPTTITVGNLPSGTNITGWTLAEILQAILTGEFPEGNIILETSDDILTETSDLILIE